MAEGEAVKTVRLAGLRLLERIHESGPRIVWRALRERDGVPVAIKTLRAAYPRKAEVAEIRREYEIARKLGLDGVVRVHELHEYGAGNLAIEMELLGPSLADELEACGHRPLGLDRFFQVAIQLAQILGRVHEHHVVHKDVVPRNVLLDPGGEALRLIDFGIASELSRERQSITLPKRLEGSLPYISPEQTGRMNRDLDYRSDYYSLGVTLFELLTGRRPFEAEDALEWVHCHIGRTPPAAHELAPEVPEALSRVVAKLMAKDAEARYQSTFGLIADLERCRDELTATGTVRVFEPGGADVPRRFHIPQRLYGREAELEQLQGHFADVAHGATDVCLVTGYSGVGKSALVGELGKSIAGERGYLLQGKFDQFQQSQAYGAIASAFRGVMPQILGEPPERLATWRKELTNALGRNGRLLVDLVPELELIVGPQPPVADLPPEEAQNRFHILFVNFVRVFANERHPLVLFLDDLQWSDVPTLSLIQRLVAARDLSHFLFIGAYRSNAVDPSHPLTIMLQEIGKARDVLELPLAPLDREAVERLTADTLHRTPGEVRALSSLLYDKAEGNPFFLNELLKSLHEAEAIAFDAEAGRWIWDLEAVGQAEVADNVVELLVAKLRRLDDASQQVLQLAACMGGTFDLSTLAVIHEVDMARTATELEPALRRNLVLPLDDDYRYVAFEGVAEEAVNPRYRFQHDRVQQAAYELIDADRKQEVHLSIGRLIERHASPAELRERLIEVVGHLNAGRARIESGEERTALARMNLDAGLKAKASSAYDAAMAFLKIGWELLGERAWQDQHELMMQLGGEYQQCAYLTADHEEAERWSARLLREAQTPLAKAEVLSTRTRQYSTTGKMKASIEAAIEGLSLLGIDFVAEPGADDVRAEVASVETNLAGRRIADLINAPPLADAERRIAIRLLMEIFPAAFLSGSGDLFPYLVLKSVNLSLRHGNSPEAAFAYAAYGMLLCGALDDPATGYEYGRLAVAMNERFDDITLKSRIIYVYAMFIHHWSNHWSTMTPWFLRGIEAGYQSGDLLYLAYSAQDCIIWDPKLDLETASRQQEKYLGIVKDCEYRDSFDSGSLFLQMQRNFMGVTDGPFSMSTEDFDETGVVEGMRQRGFMTGIANHNIYKAEIHFFGDDYAGAHDYVRAQDALAASVMSLPQSVRFVVVAYLTRSALYPEMDETRQREAREHLDAGLVRMAAWAEHCSENFEHLRWLMLAERARIEGRALDALGLYEKAIERARDHEWRRDEAMANELAGKHLLAAGLPRAAEGYLRAARYLYYRWGARRKVEALERTYPELLRTPVDTMPAERTGTVGVRTETLESSTLDMASIMKASQRISGEIVVQQLWKTTLQMLLENAGGQWGCFVVREGDALRIQARGEAGHDSPTLDAPLPVHDEDGAPRLPLSIVHNVLRTGTPVVLNDATASGRFAADPYIAAQKPLSILCMPILRHGVFEGGIYMENNVAKGAFTEERVEVLKLLAAQAAISMENAKLYDDQVRLTEAQQRFVPIQFLESLGHADIARVGLGEHVGKVMSVMFADLRDFTPLSERLGPRALIELLNRFFSRMGEPIAHEGGFIDSYTGDEIMALFETSSDHAVRAGIEMARALEAFNRAQREAGEAELKMGIGVNTGPLVLGTVGSTSRLKCSVVGDTVNVASRIEQLTKRYRAAFLIGQQTYEALEDASTFSLRQVDRVAVKGRAQASMLYEVLDAETERRRRAKEATRETLHEAMRLYFRRDFAEARTLFEQVAVRDPEDGVAPVFAERAARYAAAPPPSDWQGYESLNTK